MSISLVVLKLEIASDSPVLSHFNYVSAKASRRLDYCATGAPFGSGEWHSSKLEEIRKESRGCREPHDIIIESLIIELCDMATKSLNRGVQQRTGETPRDHASAEGSPAKETKPSELSQAVDTPEAGCGTMERSKVTSGTQIPFFSGNHCVEVTKGVLHLFKENKQTPLGEADRSEMLCMLAVPAMMTLHDILQFISPESSHVENIRVIRDSKPNLYMVLLKFRDQKSADDFYQNFNGVRFNSIEPETCHLVYVSRVEMVKECDGACLAVPGHTELPTCPVCLERMDESVEGILTILCNHSFHDGCLAKLVQNKADGKLVELEGLSADSDEKLDSIQLEYTYLLTSQLEKQRQYFEDCIEMVQKENVKQINELKEKTQIAVEERKELERKLSQVTKDKEAFRRKSEQLSLQLNKTKAELQEEKDINKCMSDNQVGWQTRLKDVEAKLQQLQEAKDKEVHDLQEQLRDLMFYLDAKDKITSSSSEIQQEIQEGTVIVGSPGPSGLTGQKQQRKRRNR